MEDLEDQEGLEGLSAQKVQMIPARDHAVTELCTILMVDQSEHLNDHVIHMVVVAGQ